MLIIKVWMQILNVIISWLITVPEMTYNVFSGTLNPTHFTSWLIKYCHEEN